MIVRVLLFLYAVAVLPIAFWPTPVDQAFRGWVLQFAAFVRERGLIWLQYEHLEFAANILMFVPLGLLLTVELRSSRLRSWLPPVVGLVASILIEAVQLVLLPERFTTALDVVANTSGAVLGWLMTLPFVRPVDDAAPGMRNEEQLVSSVPASSSRVEAQ